MCLCVYLCLPVPVFVSVYIHPIIVVVFCLYCHRRPYNRQYRHYHHRRRYHHHHQRSMPCVFNIHKTNYLKEIFENVVKILLFLKTVAQ